MPLEEHPAAGLYGQFRDVIRGAAGPLVVDRGWEHNAIVVDCRRLLAGFIRGTPTAVEGIVGLEVGMGLPSWDAAGPPPPTPAQAALVDAHPHQVPRSDLQLEFIDPATGAVSPAPTGTLQIKATLGPGIPAWPDADHATSTLREFGLIARLDGNPVLINYRTHTAIAKDPASTLERTVWLVF